MQAQNEIVARDRWLAARRQLLAAEKEFTRLRDDLSRRRRELPWVRVDKPYRFEGPDGVMTLADLFGGGRQLIVYHFMFHPEWSWGCKSCSFWADHFDGMIPHLSARDTTLVAVSRGPLAKLRTHAERLGWRFNWVSSSGSDFNFDFEVSFDPAVHGEDGGNYNFTTRAGTMFAGAVELPGFSVFFRDPASGEVFHTYSTFGRGIDLMNGTYNLLDLTPLGRNEDGLPDTMTWVRLHDEYAA